MTYLELFEALCELPCDQLNQEVQVVLSLDQAAVVERVSTVDGKVFLESNGTSKVTKPDFTDRCIWSELLLDYLSPDTEAYRVGCSRTMTFWKTRTFPLVCPDCGKPTMKDTDSIHTFIAATGRKRDG